MPEWESIYLRSQGEKKDFWEKKGLGLKNPSPKMVAVQGLEPRTSRI
jgi:hypothetical protein